MVKKVLKGKVEYNEWSQEYDIEFGRFQAHMGFSANGSIARALKLRHEDKVEVTIKKVK